MTHPSIFLITCEHGGNRVPPRYQPFFRDHGELLQTHRGYDPGALTMAREFAAALAATLFVSTTSRLLIDLNRSVRHPQLYSEATRNAPEPIRREIMKRYYLPYRTKAESFIHQAVTKGGRVVHISCHSFTPQLNDKVRTADIGLLYDPTRSAEIKLCARWQATLKSFASDMKVRRNYPYAGRSAGLTAYLRRRFPADVYLGIELEINQKHVLKGGRGWRALRRLTLDALRQALAGT